LGQSGTPLPPGGRPLRRVSVRTGGVHSWVVDGRGVLPTPDPDVLAELIAASRDLVASAADEVARAQRIREQSQELVRRCRSRHQSR